MLNRFRIDLRKGQKVTAHHPRGGTISGRIVRMYTQPGYGKRIELDTGNSVSIDDVLKVHEGMDAVDEALRAVIGTLAHNRSFTSREISEYTRADPHRQAYDGHKVIGELLKAGLIAKASRGHYGPTSLGWTWIEGERANAEPSAS